MPPRRTLNLNERLLRSLFRVASPRSDRGASRSWEVDERNATQPFKISLSPDQAPEWHHAEQSQSGGVLESETEICEYSRS